MAALQYLESFCNAHSQLSDWYTTLADLYQKKLWHQLTLKLEQFVVLPVFQVFRVEFYLIPVNFVLLLLYLELRFGGLGVYKLGFSGRDLVIGIWSLVVMFLKGSLGVTGKVVALWPRGHGFRSWKQPLVEMQAEGIPETTALPTKVEAGDALIQLYHNFITDFETKINLLKLAHFAVIVSRQYPEKEAAIGFLEGVTEKLHNTKKTRIEEPILYIKMQIALFKLEQGDPKECQKLLDEGKTTLDSMTDIDPSVYASYYWGSCQYHKARQEFAEFYKSALLYLAYTAVEYLSESFKLDLAFDLSLSALLGDNIYNFGELLAHPISESFFRVHPLFISHVYQGTNANDNHVDQLVELVIPGIGLIKSLIGTKVEWLYYILEAFNTGDLVLYQKLCNVHQAALTAQPALVQNEKKLLEKINILCLMEIIFSRPADDRTIPLSVIAESTKLSVEDVEYLLMKSLSVHLIEGIIDQVEGTVHVSWVQPRVLGIPQIKSLRDRLDNWVDKVHTALLSVEAETPDLVAA
ncbi:hypothetical protein RND71_025978 [Anisodus tanguticus]|uniref:PCI domain-containing protein n=1 Tax=Anisodus tanguticus TaxID=243964 RepID=A0AAE1VA07_9SOLA|nr:hypothetical protein RND71_025978 [Anisodus tanguticus]